MKHPILGDDFYGGIGAERLYLHALSLEITLPDSERKVFSAKLPSSFMKPKISNDG
jgi:23S rRNA-/tRNA-specific pseudouridylate synthase